MSASATAPGPSQSRSPERSCEQPVFYAALAFAAGVALSTYFFRPQAWWFAAVAVFLVATVALIRRPHFAFASALCAISALGAYQAQLQLADVPPAQDHAKFLNGDEVIVTARVVRAGLTRRVAGMSRSDEVLVRQQQVLEVETEQVESYGAVRAEKFGIRLNLYSRDFDEDVAASPEFVPANFVYGQRLRFPVKLREPRNYGNPGAMDHRGYLLDKGIVALGSVRSDRVQVLEGFAGSKWNAWRYRVRSDLTARMLALAEGSRLPQSLRLTEEQVGLLAAMLIGEQSLLDRDTKLEFQRTGAFHILVVSGMNVGILAGVIFWVSRRLRLGQVLATVTTIVLSLAYAYITDLGAPILRATVMLAIYLAARLLYRDRHSLNAVGIAALAVLAYSPKAVFEPSFQLTFLSVVALGGIVQPILERTSVPYRRALAHLDWLGYDAVLEPRMAQFRLDLRLILGRVELLAPWKWAQRVPVVLLTGSLRAALALYDVFVVTAILQLALALPMSIYFHRLALLGVPANLVVIPLTAVLMPAGIAATLLSYISESLAAIPVAVSAVTLSLITAAVQYLGGLRFADVRVATPSFAVASLCVAAFVFAMVSVRRRRMVAAGGILALILGAALLMRAPQPQFPPGVLEVSVIDVGQGDSILVVTPEGKTLLVDGGGPSGPPRAESFDVGEDVVSQYLWERGVTRLDAVVLTHAHSDHLSGLRSVITNFKPKELWMGVNQDSDQLRSLLAVATRENVQLFHRNADQEAFEFGGAKFTVLSPPRDFVPSEKTRNENSLVLSVAFGETSALLTGDAEKLTEQRIAAAAQQADLLKIAHHGSATSTSEEMLAAVQPQMAVVSAGYRNLYGHPKPAVLDRLAKKNVRTYRTDTAGVVTFYLDGKAVEARVLR